jgi:tetratricopeptide (TPR) repeat protein
LIEANPDIPSYQGNLAYAYNRLGIVHKDAGDRQAAVAAYQNAIPILERLVAAHPEFSKNAVMLGGCYCNLANALIAAGDCERALGFYDQAIRTLGDVLQANPRDANARKFLCNSHHGKSDALVLLTRYSDALPELDRCIALSDEPNRSQYRQTRAWVLAWALDHEQAVREIDKLLDAGAPPAQRLFAAASVYAVASAAAGHDEKLGEPDRTALAERHRARAMELLVAAHGAGHFKSPAAVESLKTMASLDPLRSRADFQQLLATVEHDATPPSRP